MPHSELINQFKSIVGGRGVITKSTKTDYYRSGFRSGKGAALAVVFPGTILQQWELIKICVKYNCIIIMQAAKTGLTEGSSPSGDKYDRDVIIINTLKIKKIHIINNGKQAISLSGATLHNLEEKLRKINRIPHSVIGSSQIGATVVGGIANNSGGALVKRGPAYTELALFAQIDDSGRLNLVNNLGINNIGQTPEEILSNIQKGCFSLEDIKQDSGLASDNEYSHRVRDIKSNIPARFNADDRRLFEASGCAGKLGVFAVRTDTFPMPKKEQVFYLGTNDPKKLTQLRRHILKNFKNLPDMAEYMHRTTFNITKTYGKDTFLSIKLLGTKNIPKFFTIKSNIENILKQLPLFSDTLIDKGLFYLSKLFPECLPRKMIGFHKKYEHHLILSTSDKGIGEAKMFLENFWKDSNSNFFTCNDGEAKMALLHRFSAGVAATRYQTIHGEEVGSILPLDVALRRNDEEWEDRLPPGLEGDVLHSLYYGHFLCNVFHRVYILKKKANKNKIKAIMLLLLNDKGAKYPAEHNVGHLYKADNNLQEFYKQLDPTNTFNPGIGQMNKYSNHCNCC